MAREKWKPFSNSPVFLTWADLAYPADFRTVDYDAIAMLNVSATQELVRKVDALQNKLDQTMAEKEALQKRLAALETRD